MNGFQELTMLGNAQNVDLSIGIKTKSLNGKFRAQKRETVDEFVKIVKSQMKGGMR